MQVRWYNYNGTQLTNVLFDNTGSTSLYYMVVGIKIPTTVMATPKSVRVTVAAVPATMTIPMTTDYTSVSTWNYIHLVCVGCFDTVQQAFFVGFSPNVGGIVEIKIELSSDGTNFRTIATGTIGSLKIFATGNAINGINSNFGLSGNDFKKKSIIVGTGCADTDRLLAYAGNNFVNIADIAYKAPVTWKPIYDNGAITITANAYNKYQLPTYLDTSKPFRVEAWVTFPSNINTAGHNYIWRPVTLYATVATGESAGAGYLQFRLHNNTNASPSQKAGYISYNAVTNALENSNASVFTDALSGTGLHYVIESLDGKKLTRTIGDKTDTISSYTPYTFSYILFGRAPSASYEQATGNMRINRIVIYN